jgi:hypothetical protein
MEMEIQSAGITLKSEISIYHQKNGKKINVYIAYILISAGMKFRNKEKFRYGIPAYTGPFRALDITSSTRKMRTCPYTHTHTHTHNVEP